MLYCMTKMTTLSTPQGKSSCRSTPSKVSLPSHPHSLHYSCTNKSSTVFVFSHCFSFITFSSSISCLAFFLPGSNHPSLSLSPLLSFFSELNPFFHPRRNVVTLFCLMGCTKSGFSAPNIHILEKEALSEV